MKNEEKIYSTDFKLACVPDIPTEEEIIEQKQLINRLNFLLSFMNRNGRLKIYSNPFLPAIIEQKN